MEAQGDEEEQSAPVAKTSLVGFLYRGEGRRKQSLVRILMVVSTAFTQMTTSGLSAIYI